MSKHSTAVKPLRMNTTNHFIFFILLSFYSSSFFIFDHQARADILRIHSRKMNLTRGINLKKIAEAMPGSSGAEIKVCKECY